MVVFQLGRTVYILYFPFCSIIISYCLKGMILLPVTFQHRPIFHFLPTCQRLIYLFVPASPLWPPIVSVHHFITTWILRFRSLPRIESTEVQDLSLQSGRIHMQSLSLSTARVRYRQWRIRFRLLRWVSRGNGFSIFSIGYG